MERNGGRKNNKLNELEQLPPLGVDSILFKNVACNGSICFVNETLFSSFDMKTYPKYSINSYNLSTFSIVDSLHGAVCCSSDGVIQFIKLPRAVCQRCVGKKGHLDASLLQKEIRVQKNTIRGTVMKNTVDHGISVHRGSRGLGETPYFRQNFDFKCEMIQLCKRINHSCSSYVPSSLLTKFADVRDSIITFPTMSELGTTCSVSVAVDHISAVHTDKDFFLTYLTARSSPDPESEGMNFNSNFNAPIAYHFVFPTIGYAVGISPGDILIFNPNVPHCCASNLSHYENVPVFLASFYIKCGHVGGNDNSKLLSPVQNLILYTQ